MGLTNVRPSSLAFESFARSVCCPTIRRIPELAACRCSSISAGEGRGFMRLDNHPLISRYTSSSSRAPISVPSCPCVIYEYCYPNDARMARGDCLSQTITSCDDIEGSIPSEQVIAYLTLWNVRQARNAFSGFSKQHGARWRAAKRGRLSSWASRGPYHGAASSLFYVISTIDS